jgi:hypothetical protein
MKPLSNTKINYNSKRFRIYPIIILITTWSIVAINIFTRDGWQGGFGQIIGSDFITLYSAGLLYRDDIEHLYDLEVQWGSQQDLVEPTNLKGVNPFISPPYVALAYSLFAKLPLQYAFISWSAMSLLLLAMAIPLLLRLIPEQPKSTRISRFRLLIIILAFFPFILGWQVGQNHTLTLLLISAILVFTMKNRPILAGLMAGFLIYKPQFAIGFLIIWLVWREYRALLAFGCISAIWIAISLIHYGIPPYQQYGQMGTLLLNLPYIDGFPGYLLVTIYGFLATLLPNTTAPIISNLVYPIMILCGAGLALIAFTFRKRSLSERIPVIILAVLYPFLATPYVLFHDLLILFPVFILWQQNPKSQSYFIFSVLLFYLGGLLLPTSAHFLQVAIMAIIPLVVFYGIINILRNPKPTLPDGIGN